ncbi:PTS sugar transporter subunit IIA [Enterococcus faecalis]|uniref:PTS sugar transporter subunit IIA n=2 Tax=Enterococcus faecalis TaxID=1351 RepID=A0ABD7IVN8_ENTFL|nr:PTS sugar transporter subunit IIA [Enterococcus faecalis]EGO2662637.1 PTS sugar transporter subunit IIA [Enterococcus faecalis]EGO2744177.1 PTS sugar transporter subunit IIA [Enterococcus faecalis]EGO2804341.1 PTS sugar transporter subunit IIA [Enterococcus faecalis]EGO2813076.1 PTS sugar transporter subunit IIA [Enterococcus faecalis]EGO2821724.1 PTS sugar transporter subunit IIA [Enterococcus faecalis]
MSIIGELMQEELIDLSCGITSKRKFFKTKVEVLKGLKLVEETYLKSVIEREKEYPTGLKLANVSVAIPHTSINHIKKPFIYFNRLMNKKIEFIQMGTDDVIVKPDYILMLGIKEPREQVNLLAEIINLFNQKEFVTSIRNAKSKKEIMELFDVK